VFNNVDTQNNDSILAYRTVSLKSLLAASIEIAKRGGAEVKAIREQVFQNFHSLAILLNFRNRCKNVSPQNFLGHPFKNALPY
jgi:hypothetical protein